MANLNEKNRAAFLRVKDYYENKIKKVLSHDYENIRFRKTYSSYESFSGVFEMSIKHQNVSKIPSNAIIKVSLEVTLSPAYVRDEYLESFIERNEPIIETNAKVVCQLFKGKSIGFASFTDFYRSFNYSNKTYFYPLYSNNCTAIELSGSNDNLLSSGAVDFGVVVVNALINNTTYFLSALFDYEDETSAGYGIYVKKHRQTINDELRKGLISFYTKQ